MNSPRDTQRGAALLLAMIIVTLVATLAVSMVWQQWRAVQVETAERSRSQSAWILAGALDWANLLLREDGRPSGRGPVDHLGEPWAVPLAEARLSTFLAADKDNTDDGPEAFLSGSITDAQARFNLMNLLDAKFEISPPDLDALRRLCDNVSVPITVAEQLATGLKAAYSPPGPGTVADQPLKPQKLSDLTWLGVDRQALQRLEPYIVLLRGETSINVNTASREVIASVIPGLNVGDAERLIQHRQRNPFLKREDVVAQLPPASQQNPGRIAVSTDYFEVRGRLRLNDRVLEQRSLVERKARVITVLSSERINSAERER